VQKEIAPKLILITQKQSKNPSEKISSIPKAIF